MVNLDPAVLETPFGPHVDIRDTVNYKEVMKQYSLGPNGGILTALNLFATRFEQVLALLQKRQSDALRYALFDTPGQIEIFTWSASGTIITESLASTCTCPHARTPGCAPQTLVGGPPLRRPSIRWPLAVSSLPPASVTRTDGTL